MADLPDGWKLPDGWNETREPTWLRDRLDMWWDWGDVEPRTSE